MSTWQLFSDAGNNCRWEISSQQTQEPPESTSPPSRLPSMADLLLQGFSRILESPCVNVDDCTPMFQTGLGNSVVLKESSMVKALSVLGDDRGAGDDAGHSQVMRHGCENIDRTPLFSTGSGKPVMLQQSSIAKALSVLKDDNSDISAQQHFKDNECSFSNSFFQTGSGKMVNISAAGLNRAISLFGLNESHESSAFQGFKTERKERNSNNMRASGPLSDLDKREIMVDDMVTGTSALFPEMPFYSRTGSLENEFGEGLSPLVQPKMHASSVNPLPIKFNTAGGRSISVSSDALQRAKSLLGDPELGSLLDEGEGSDSVFKSKVNSVDDQFLSTENVSNSSQIQDGSQGCKQSSKSFISPMKTPSKRSRLSAESTDCMSELMQNKFAEDCFNKENCTASSAVQRNHMTTVDSLGSETRKLEMSSGGPLFDITNSIGMDCINKRQPTYEIRRLGRRSSISPFKRPRSSKFIAPLNHNFSSSLKGSSNGVRDYSSHRKHISNRYPGPASRTYIKEFFGVPENHYNMLQHLPEAVRLMNLANAEKFKFYGDSGVGIGVEAFYHMLAQSGASMQYASQEWIANHYKWIVWKLACYERCCPVKFSGKLLTVSNVLEDLKYRYDREVNYGHRSSIAKILEGNASPSSMLVLCISATYPDCSPEVGNQLVNGTEKRKAARVELTDGWYSIEAQFDVLLSKHLALGRLFVGQKLRICGAGLSGWTGPVSPFEASRTVNLVLHINGTYKASWADRLGFCRGACTPLAFRCIKSNGGLIPRTLVGVTRIYPVLYKERMIDGACIVRSRKMEDTVMQLHNQRKSNIIEGVVSDFQRGAIGHCNTDDQDSEEGAKILKMLETAAEPELLMAEMSSEKLASFANYRAKVEENRHSDIQKSIEKALKDAGLGAREVTPFMRVRVVGLTTKGCRKSNGPLEGLITIWNPTEKQQYELAEGQAYSVSGLMPLHSDLNILYLQAKGSGVRWQPLTSSEMEAFGPFFNPRKLCFLSNLGEVAISSEFDTVGLVVHVGREYRAAQQIRQWVFVTNGSLVESQTAELNSSLLAISFCSPCTDDDTTPPINHNLVGSIVGFCNLVKRARDHVNDMWVAEATENSAYHLHYDHPFCSHLKYAFTSVDNWARSSTMTLKMLREKILFIIDDPDG